MKDVSGLRPLVENLLISEADILTYAYDSALERARPDAVVVARCSEEVQRVVAWCVERGVPYVARGAGTNLSGGCIPLRGGVVISLAQMNRILSISPDGGFAIVEPGVINLDLQKKLEALGRFYVPDPASYRVCTLGGNVGENAGGPRCLKYGVTTHHIRKLEVIMPDGTLARFSSEDHGPEILSLLVGAEGTLGVVTKIWVDILPVPESISTLLAAFPSLDSAMACVADIIASGIYPRVLEAMDRLTVDSIEAHVRSGYPRAEAVLLIELEGGRVAAASDVSRVISLCKKHGCSEHRLAQEAAQRERLWEGRRSAYAALARLAPNVLVEDGVVPRSQLPVAARRVREICERHRVQAGLLFHAGDGNLHPNIIFDERDKELTARVKRAGYEMLQACVELGGSISGEHGIGSDKRAAMSWLFSKETLDLFRRIKRAMDPWDLANPDKILPLAGEGMLWEFQAPPQRPLSDAAQSLAECFREKARRKEEVVLLGAGSKAATQRLKSALSTRGLNRVMEFDRLNYTLTVEAGALLVDILGELEPLGFYAPIPAMPGTLGGLLATKPWPGLRQHVLGMRILLVDGTVAQVGASVVKNVAGYDVPRLLLGSWGSLAVILEVTLRLYPFRVPITRVLAAGSPPSFGPWHKRLKDAFDPEHRLNPWVGQQTP